LDHSVAGLVGFVIILIFWTSTVSVELLGSPEAVAEVKRAIRWGLILLVPALAITGLSGFRMAGQSTNAQVLTKKRRMPYIAGIGLVILVPAALYLAAKVDDGLETGFYLVQAVELLAGATNLTLMGLNIRDGLRITGRLGSATPPTA
jgi:hypothetical protein